MFGECAIKVFDLGLKTGTWESKEDDAGVRQFLLENELAEISVSDNEDPLLLPSDCKDVLVGKAVRVVTRDC